MNEYISKKLTKRQTEIVEYVKKGFQDKEIADYLNISTHTIKTHLKNIYFRLGVGGRTELAGLDELHYDVPNEESTNVAGYWLSKFEYSAFRSGLNDYVYGAQYDLEYLEEERSNFFSFKGENILCACNSKIKYFHDLLCYVNRNNLVGIWINKDTTRNTGCFQLYIGNNGNIMTGKHLGNASDNSIQSGKWVWIKVECNAKLNKSSLDLIKIEQLDSIFDQLIIEDAPVHLNEITQKR